MLRLSCALLALAFTLPLSSQTASKPAKPMPPHPATQQAPGAAPDKVWVNAKTNVYHCPGDRYYGRTKEGKYMTEPEARKAGYKGARGETCFAKQTDR